MERLLEKDTPLTHDELEKLAPALRNLQGNILQGHRRKRSVHIFMQFMPGRAGEAKQWMGQVAAHIISAQQQREEHKPRGVFCSFVLSAKGYIALGLKPPFDSAFKSGMQARVALHDPPKEHWEPAYQHDIHAMLLLAANDAEVLQQAQQQHLATIEGFAQILAQEFGRVLRNADGRGIEHFGYVDGRSQPLFFAEDVTKETCEKGGTDKWNPGAGPRLVLIEDPYGNPCGTEGPAYGSYLVFRKLEQNVHDFQVAINALTDLLQRDEETVKALVVGRFPDGKPLILPKTAGEQNVMTNNFTFADDPYGERCPLQAHIRRVNPRGGFAESVTGTRDRKALEAIELRRRLVRRAIPYGTREKEPKDHPSLEELPSKDVGLLFMCYQRNIRDQFEFLQAEWANNEHFLGHATGLDALIGQVRPGRTAIKQPWPSRDGHPLCFGFNGYVTLKGGEYFFAPSISFLASFRQELPDAQSKPLT